MVLEISINLGRGFSALSELSILKSCIPPTLKKGSKIRPRDNIPNPPIHWIIALQRRMGLSLISRSEIIVDPVVVSPETASKIASTDESGFSPSINGREQISGQIHQSKFTTIIPNLAETLGVSPLDARATKRQIILEVVAAQKNGPPPFQLKIKDIIQGKYIRTEKSNPAKETIWQAERNSCANIKKTLPQK